LLSASLPDGGGTRFLIEAYPFLLLVAAGGLVKLSETAGHWGGRWGQRVALVAVVTIAGSGVLGGHGVPSAFGAATLKHGDKTNVATLGYPFYPDHQAPGQFVRQHRAPRDIIVAEDVLQQRWYVGSVDYWLRDYVESRKFLYQDPDGRLRDMYVNSIAATPDVLEFLSGFNGARVWVITSGETYPKREYYLNTVQQRWLHALETTRVPVFSGRDGVTKVYCLNCPGIRPHGSSLPTPSSTRD